MFDATMLAGPVKLLASARVLSSPARVRVTRYLKGHGPRTVQVQTAVTPSANGVTVNADGIQPQAGQHWRIYSDRSRQPFPTSVCAGSRPLKASRRGLRRFTGSGLTFAYPATWHAHRYQVNSSFSTAIVYLSPQRMHAPCVTHHGTRNTTIVCHQPVTRLRPGSILAFWSLNSMPGWRPQDAMGAPLRIGGRPAKLRVTHDTCGIGAQQTLDAVIPIPGSGNSFDEFIACIRGPHTATKAHQAHDLLNSVRFDH